MPLLRNETFIPKKCSIADPRQEVFYLSLTKEVFLNYDEFFERSILCNSMVWGCALTGKSNLTYFQALKSERDAQKNLEAIPEYIHSPILMLAGLSHFSRMSDLVGNLSTFFRYRFAIGERVEVSCDGVKTNGVIVNIKCPAVQAYQKLDSSAPVPVPPPEELRYFVKCSSNLKYENGKKKGSPVKDNIGVFNAFALSRYNHGQRSGNAEVLNKTKLNEFLKICCKTANKRIVVKEEYSEKLSLQKLSVQEFFGHCPLPDFAISEELMNCRKEVLARNNLFFSADSAKVALSFEFNGVNKKRLLKQTEDNISKKKKKLDQQPVENGIIADHAVSAITTKTLENGINERLEEIRKEEEREQKRRRAEWLKKWSKVRDDVELEDHKDIPVPTALSAHLGNSTYTGDALFPGIISILDFINTFRENLKVQTYLPDSKLSFSFLIEALHDSNVLGKLYLILSCLVTNVLNCLDELTTFDIVFEEQTEILSEISSWDFLSSDNQNVLLKASDTAFFSLSHIGIPLSRLPIDPYTISEVLRLLFSAAGFKSLQEILKLKSQRCHFFNAREDPLVDFNISHQRIIHRLEYKSVYRLNVEEKVKILNCLCDELLSIKPDLKELVTNSAELIQETRAELKKFHKSEQKWRRDFNIARCWKQQKLNSDLIKLNNNNTNVDSDDIYTLLSALTKLEADSLADLKRSLIDLVTSLDPTEFQEDDRSVFRYMELSQILQVEALFDGELPDALFECDSERERFFKILNLIRAQLETRSSNEENRWMSLLVEHQSTWATTPLGRDRVHRRYWKFRSVPGIFVEEDIEFRKWAEVNGQKGHYTPPCLEENPNWDIEDMAEQGFNGAPMHPKWPALESVPCGSDLKTTWSFYYTQSSIDALIESMNDRGLRESALKDSLLSIRRYLFHELENFESAEFFEMLCEYDPAEMGNQCANLDLVEIFCKSCKVFFERLANGPFLNSSLTMQDRQQMLSQINRGFIRDSNASLSGATSVQSYAEILSKLTAAIRKDYLGPPLASKLNDDQYIIPDSCSDLSNGTSGTATVNYKIESLPFMERWMTAMQSSSGFAQLFLFLQVLNMSIKWSKPSGNFGLKKTCSTCFLHATNMSDQMQLCKVCNVAYHKNPFCFGLKHNAICSNCHRYKVKLTVRNVNVEASNSNSGSRSLGRKVKEQMEPEEDAPSELDKFAILPVVDDGVFCESCGLGGFVLCCDKCPRMFHLKCADPPLKDVPANDWFCQICTGKVTQKEFDVSRRSNQRSRMQNLMQ